MNVPRQSLFNSASIVTRQSGYSYLPGNVLSAVSPRAPVATFGTGASPTQIGVPVAHPVSHVAPPYNAVNSPVEPIPVAYPAPIAHPVSGSGGSVFGIFSAPSAPRPVANPVKATGLAHLTNGLFS